ncbi:MAG: metallophosphoesterase [DPANN group archaeon]|nr:metallophosphoesterase [DPANN group archaeon]
MKILTVGDLHGDVSQAKKLAEQAKKESVDLVVVNGDFTTMGNHTPGLFQAFSGVKSLAILPGNHESSAVSDAMSQKYGAIHLHGYYKIFGDVGIVGCGSANIGIFQLPEDEIEYLLERGFERIKDCKKKVMITHVHPSETRMEMGLFEGSQGVRNIIEKFQPDAAICSHIHEADGIEDTIGKTRVICASKSGRILEI